MWRTFCYWLSILVLLSCDIPSVRAEMSEEDKKRLFLRARQDLRPVPRPAASATPRPKPRTVTTPRPTPRPTPEPTPEPTPRSKPTPDQEDRSTPKPRERDDEEPPKRKSTPKPTPKKKSNDKDQIDAPIVIEKSGLQKDEGYLPPAKNIGGWFKRWRYLPSSLRRAIDRAPVKKGRWKYIIIHNSGTRQGNARIFDTYHRKTRKMQNGMAYHFVIGNGSSSGDGEIEIGSRWTKQINGGHVASDYLNNISLGICLVGDLNRDRPTKKQLAALDELIQYLRGRVGKVKGKPSIVVPHKKINPKPTDCPGDRFPYKWMSDKF